jgi:hypothetical protein
VEELREVVIVKVSDEEGPVEEVVDGDEDHRVREAWAPLGVVERVTAWTEGSGDGGFGGVVVWCEEPSGYLGVEPTAVA